jgi:hypothetical protein
MLDADIEFYGISDDGVVWASWPACPVHSENRQVSPVFHPEFGELRNNEATADQAVATNEVL